MKTLTFLLHLLLVVHGVSISFVHNGFLRANLELDKASFVRPDGILALTNNSKMILGHGLYPSPLQFKRRKPNSNKSLAVTFSTNFVFSIIPKYTELGGHGLTFLLISDRKPKNCLANQYLGLPNASASTATSTRFLAVEFDVVQNLELQDINDNHVGIDISSLVSNVSEPALYSVSNSNQSKKCPIILKSGRPVQVWIDYNNDEMLMNVSISPCGMPRPYLPLISLPIDLSVALDEYMYVGFSASTGLLSAFHYVHGWSFRIGGKAQELDPMKLTLLKENSRKLFQTKGFIIGITLASITLFVLVICGTIQVLIGSGGFGKVYRGTVSGTGQEVAIKRIHQNSRQGMREFVAEITSMGPLRHRNLVQLHGWCRKQDELLLVYDYIPNGSLEGLLFVNENLGKKHLTWEQRYKILIGVAHALLCLHEECYHTVVHRDVKPSNILRCRFQCKVGRFWLGQKS